MNSVILQVGTPFLALIATACSSGHRETQQAKMDAVANAGVVALTNLFGRFDESDYILKSAIPATFESAVG